MALCFSAGLNGLIGSHPVLCMPAHVHKTISHDPCPLERHSGRVSLHLSSIMGEHLRVLIVEVEAVGGFTSASVSLKRLFFRGYLAARSAPLIA